MEVYDYIKRLRKGIERVENYGYTESVEIREEIRPQKQVVINAIISIYRWINPVYQRIY